MIRIRLALMLYFFMVVHKAACHTLLWAVGRSFGPVREGIRRSRRPQSLPVMGETACSKTRARKAEGFHDNLKGQMFDLERDGLRQVVPCP